MPAPRKPLTAPERRYLSALKRMERDFELFTHRGICDVLGFRSVARSFQLMTALIEKGHVQAGARLALVEVPVTTAKGQRELRKAA